MERGQFGLCQTEEAKFWTSKSYGSSYLECKKTGLTERLRSDPNLNKASTPIVRGILAGLAKVLAPLKDNASLLNDADRHAVMAALHDAAYEVETAIDLFRRLADTGKQLPIIKVGNQLGIFKALFAAKRPMSAVELSKPTRADPRLVVRICRYLAANRMVLETARETYAANASTERLADDAFACSIDYMYEVSNPVAHELPKWLEQRKFQNLQGNEGGRTVFQQAHDVDLGLFPWLKTQPPTLRNFQQYMTMQRSSPSGAADWLSFVQLQKPASPAVKAFVDVGGNVGHQCQRLLTAYPNLAGSIVLQDLEETVKAAPPIEGVEIMAHDFFTPNPVKGASYYYLRSILHDWSDDKVVKILENLALAMGPESMIIIDDRIMPDTGAAVWPAGQDLQMMMLFGAAERTEGEWRALVDRAGLKVTKTETYAAVDRASIIFAHRK